MPITHAVTHHIRRASDAEATLALRTDEMDVEGYSESLLSRLKSGFLGRLTREHGSFATDAQGAPLRRELEAFLSNDADFLQISRSLMEALRHVVNEQRIDIDTHFLFFMEESFDHRVFYLFAAHHVESLAISEELEVTPSYAVDTGPSLFGIKVDVAEWKQRQNYAYLSLVPPRGDPPLADAFRKLTGFDNGLNKEEATLAFLQGVEEFSSQIPEEKLNDYRNQVVGYCIEQDERDQAIDIKGLAQSIDGIDPDEFVRVVGSHTPEGNQEVMVDRRSLRRYVKFAGREKDLAISFSSYQLNHRVHYDADTDTLSISGIPRALRNQLLEHLNKS